MIRRLIIAIAALSLTIAAKEIRFQTTEGTWLSVDVSPDGKTLVFDLLGDIYVMPASGGAAKAIVTGTSFDSQPRFSPDGRQIAFTSDRDGALNLWVAGADGSGARQVSKRKGAEMFSPAWMPDGKSILMSVVSPARQGSAELWRFPLDGTAAERIKSVTGGPLLLVSSPPYGVFGAVPSKDAAFVYYANVTPRIYNSRSGAASEIVRRDLRTGREETITSRREIAMKPVPSPDGRFLVYAVHQEDQTALRIRMMETQEERRLKMSIQLDELEARASRDVLPNFAITPDSAAVIVGFGGKIHRIEVASGKDTVIPFRADVALTVEDRLDFPVRVEEGPVRARIAQRPALSPDGQAVAFTAFGRVYTKAFPRTARPLTSAAAPGESQPVWSPDGKSVAFVTWDERGGYVWKVGGASLNN